MYDIKPGQLVEVEWVDPSIRDGWIDAEDITEFPKIICHSIGWIHLVKDEGLILNSCYGTEENDRDLLICQYLPWGCITQIWILE